jgi:putative membrane protein
MRRPHRAILVVAVVFVALALGLLVHVLFVEFGTASSPSRNGVPFFGLGVLGVLLILMIGFWCLRIALWSTRGPRGYGGGGRHPAHQHSPAIAIARQRYARGEITREQFQQIVDDIRHSR